MVCYVIVIAAGVNERRKIGAKDRETEGRRARVRIE